ncbi:MAG: hypothetical protein P8124_11340 [Gammaproteobacteria bacterium]
MSCLFRSRKGVATAPMTPAPYTTLGHVRRRLHLYLVALWGRPFAIGPLSDSGTPEEGDRPRIRDRTILLPERMGPTGPCPAQLTYRAAVAHAAAHLCHSGVMDPDGLKPRQRVVIEALEDARVEYLALTRFPGLRRLWLSQYPSRAPDPAPFPALLWRLSRGLLMQDADHDDFWVAKAVRLFLERRDRMHDAGVSREIGLWLAHDLGQMRLAMDEGRPPPLAPYRDDNLHLWRQQTVTDAGDCDGACTIRAGPHTPRRQESVSGPPLAFAEGPLAGPDEGGPGRYVEIAPDRWRSGGRAATHLSGVAPAHRSGTARLVYGVRTAGAGGRRREGLPGPGRPALPGGPASPCAGGRAQRARDSDASARLR